LPFAAFSFAVARAALADVLFRSAVSTSFLGLLASEMAVFTSFSALITFTFAEKRISFAEAIDALSIETGSFGTTTLAAVGATFVAWTGSAALAMKAEDKGDDSRDGAAKAVPRKREAAKTVEATCWMGEDSSSATAEREVVVVRKAGDEMDTGAKAPVLGRERMAKARTWKRIFSLFWFSY